MRCINYDLEWEKLVSMIWNPDDDIDEGVEGKDYSADCERMILLENVTEHLLPSQTCRELDNKLI